MDRFVRAAVLAVALAGCGHAPPPADSEWADMDVHGASCEAACASLDRLGCPEARPTPRGVPCVAVCQEVQDLDVPLLDVGCVARAGTVEAVRECHVRCADGSD